MTPTAPAAPAPRRQVTSGAYGILAVLTLANLMNFYDRSIPAVIVEPIRAEFGLTDGQIGMITASFTVVYAMAGVALGRVADRTSRRWVIAIGLVVWSLFTAAGAGAWGFVSLLLFRIGVGIGEAAYGPAANSMIFDAFPPGKRARASGIFQLGIPVGLLTAYLSVGWIVELTGSWRIPFLVAAVPGLILAALVLRLPEPRRGEAEGRTAATQREPRVERPIRTILSVPTVRWLILAGVGVQIPTYAIATFLVPLLQRFFGLGIGPAAAAAGGILGLTGIVGLLVGGVVADHFGRRSLRARTTVGAVGLIVAAPFTLLALTVDRTAVAAFVALFATGWLFQYVFGAASLPVIADVVEPRMRATAVAVYFAGFYLLGGAFGPIVAGALSDGFAAGVTGPDAEAFGLHRALLTIVPAALLLGGLAAWRAGHTVERDHDLMSARAKANR